MLFLTTLYLLAKDLYLHFIKIYNESIGISGKFKRVGDHQDSR